MFLRAIYDFSVLKAMKTISIIRLLIQDNGNLNNKELSNDVANARLMLELLQHIRNEEQICHYMLC